jgi:hypothetical protein
MPQNAQVRALMFQELWTRYQVGHKVMIATMSLSMLALQGNIGCEPWVDGVQEDLNPTHVP